MELKVELTEENFCYLLTFKEHWLLSLAWVIDSGFSEIQKKKKAQGALSVLVLAFFFFFRSVIYINYKLETEIWTEGYECLKSYK